MFRLVRLSSLPAIGFEGLSHEAGPSAPSREPDAQPVLSQPKDQMEDA
jgi:hypothetical protein